MKTNATNFYYIKLRNLFLAHQETYALITKGNVDSIKKLNLQKKLRLYDSQIKKILTERCSKSNFNEKQTNESSVYFAIKEEANSQISKQKQFISEKNSTDTTYYIRNLSRPILSLENDVLKNNVSKEGICTFMECLDDKISKDELQKEGIIVDLVEVPEMPSADNDTNQDGKESDEMKPPVTEIDAPKINFFHALDLMSRVEYNEFQSRKNSRKRRTTANPQFSSAALEAKRVTKMEIIAERKLRRQLATQKQDSFNKLKNGNELRSPNNKMSRFLEDKTKNLFKIENKQLYPGLYLVKKISNTKYYCKVCTDICQCSVDTVIVCKKCSSFFHLTCVIPKKEMSKAFELNCPGCCIDSGVVTDTLTCSGERNDFLKRLNELRKYIVSLTKANQILQLLCKKRESEKDALHEEIGLFHSQISLMKNGLTKFYLNLGGSNSLIGTSESGSNVQTDSSEISLHNALNESNQSDSTSGGHLTEHSSTDEFNDLSSLYSHSNQMYNSPESKCDTDLPIISLCV